MQRLHIRLLAALREERGSMTLLMTGLIVVAVVVTLPMVWNIGAVRVVRHHSQNSSDAAALAAAESSARRLNALSRDWWGCVPPKKPRQIVERYMRSVVAPVAASNIGRGAAVQYASQNRGTVARYSQWLRKMKADGVHAKLVDGVAILPIHADVRSSAPVTGLIGAGFLEDGSRDPDEAPTETPAHPLEGMPVLSQATAETYLDWVRTWQTPCPTDSNAVARHYQFRWKVRLVKTGW